MVKGSMWRNPGCSQQPFLLSNEFFSHSPTDNPLSLCSETLGLPKLQSVLGAAGRRVCVVPQSPRRVLRGIPDSRPPGAPAEPIYTSLFPQERPLLSQGHPRAPVMGRVHPATSIIGTLLRFLLDEGEIAHGDCSVEHCHFQQTGSASRSRHSPSPLAASAPAALTLQSLPQGPRPFPALCPQAAT